MDQKSHSISSISPILRRTSGLFDSFFDWISAGSVGSESTHDDSDYVTQQIREFERERAFNVRSDSAQHTNIQVSVVIDKSLFDRGIIYCVTVYQNYRENFFACTENPSNGTFSRHILSRSISVISQDINQTETNLRSSGATKAKKETNRERLKKFVKNRKVLTVVYLLFVFIVAASLATTWILSPNPPMVDDTTQLPTEPPTTQLPNHPPTISTPPTTIPTPPPPPINYPLIPRALWDTQNCPLVGRYKKSSPSKKLIVTRTTTNNCFDEVNFAYPKKRTLMNFKIFQDSCINFLFERQQKAYPKYDDIRENFLIGLNGNIYEARGFGREGETTSESGTSYNNKAVSVSFIQMRDNDGPNSHQQRALCQFIRESVENRTLYESYTAFHHSDLTSSFFEYQPRELEHCKEVKWQERNACKLFDVGKVLTFEIFVF